MCLIRSIDDVCGREIKGGGSVVRFCSKPQDMCEIVSHAKSKVNLNAGTFYPYVPKNGVKQVRLVPSMHVSLLPPNEVIKELLEEEKTVALWREPIWKPARLPSWRLGVTSSACWMKSEIFQAGRRT